MELQQAVAFTLSVCFHFQCVQGLGMGYLKSRFSEMQLIKGGVFVLIWAYLLLVSGTSKFLNLVLIVTYLKGGHSFLVS